MRRTTWLLGALFLAGCAAEGRRTLTEGPGNDAGEDAVVAVREAQVPDAGAVAADAAEAAPSQTETQAVPETESPIEAGSGAEPDVYSGPPPITCTVPAAASSGYLYQACNGAASGTVIEFSTSNGPVWCGGPILGDGAYGVVCTPGSPCQIVSGGGPNTPNGTMGTCVN